MPHVLIASLGESPIVITSMVKALREGNKIPLDKIIVMYPEEEPTVKDAFDLIGYQLNGICQVEACPLPFPDANNYERCFLFLQILYGCLEMNAQECNSVYLSLAGGRKSTSALIAVLAPFYPNIHGLYHILDKCEENPARRIFYSTEELYDFRDEIRNAKMNPPLENLKLIEIPFQYFARADELRKILSLVKTSEESLGSVPVSPESEGFFAGIFQKRIPDKALEIQLSPQALKRYKTLGANQQRSFREYFRQLQFQSFRGLQRKDKGGKHGGPFQGENIVFWCAKRAGTGERLFWYEKESQVVICELGLKSDGSYVRLSKNFTHNQYSTDEYPPEFSLRDLSEEGILLAPLGKSPMVVTQAYRLLQEREGIRIGKIGLIFPGKNGEITNGVSYLKDAFRTKNIEINEYSLPLLDVDSKDACEEFLKKIVQAIDELQYQNPERSFHLLLSGGRKGMSALTLFAAQRSKIQQVYHTLISDLDMEKRLEKEGYIAELGKCRSKQERTERLFMKEYDLSKFELFKIPVIPLEIKSS